MNKKYQLQGAYWNPLVGEWEPWKTLLVTEDFAQITAQHPQAAKVEERRIWGTPSVAQYRWTKNH